MKNIERLLSMKRNPENMNMIFTFGIPKDWILVDNENIICENDNLVQNNEFKIYNISYNLFNTEDDVQTDFEIYNFIDDYISKIVVVNEEIELEIEKSKKRIEEIKRNIMNS